MYFVFCNVLCVCLQIKSVANIKYRLFDFDSFPSHVRDMLKYSWKPLVIAVSLSFKLFFVNHIV